MRTRFWELKLEELTPPEWEALCDRCGLCCLIKLRDEYDEVAYTDVACKLLNTKNAQCSDYAHRFDSVPDCLTLSMELLKRVDWLPQSCAYRLRLEDKPLPDWHPLISQNPLSVIEVRAGAAGRCVSEHSLSDEEIEERVVQWVEF